MSFLPVDGAGNISCYLVVVFFLDKKELVCAYVCCIYKLLLNVRICIMCYHFVMCVLVAQKGRHSQLSVSDVPSERNFKHEMTYRLGSRI